MSLTAIKTIICELTGRKTDTVDVSQGDRGSRAVSCRLLEAGASWMIPDGATARVAYTLPDGTDGLYDRRPDGSPMWEISGNTVTVELADQLMAQAGMVQMSVLILGPEGGQLATWPIRVNVSANNAARLTVPEAMPPYGAGFAGKIFYGGEDGTVTPLGIGDGVEIVRNEDGTFALVAYGGSGGAGNWDELEGKPTYVQVGPRTVMWDGAMDGERFVAKTAGSTATWLKISGEIPSREELIGAELTHSSEYFDPGPIDAIEDGVGCYGSEDYGILVVTQAGEIEDDFGREGVAPGTGIYVQLEGYEGQGSPSLRMSYGEYSQEKFDPAWLPDGGVGWEGPGGKTDILPETELVVDENTQTIPMPDGRTLYGYLLHPLPITENLTEGEEYQITIDGVTYRRKCVVPGDPNNPLHFVGNLALAEMGEDTGEDWLFFVQEATDPANYWVGVFATANTQYKTVAVRAQGTVVHTILDKFIPANIARKTDIPEQVQADWGQNDPTQPDYVKNRTHYEENNQTVIEWDGNPDDRDSVVLGEQTLVKVGSNTPDAAEMSNAILRYSVDGETVEAPVNGDIQTGDGCYLAAGLVLVVQRTDVTFGEYSAVAPSTGVYFISVGAAMSLTYGSTVVHPLDEKFIPESIARAGQIPNDEHIKDLIAAETGGGSVAAEWRLVADVTLEQGVSAVDVSAPKCQELMIQASLTTGKTAASPVHLYINDVQVSTIGTIWEAEADLTNKRTILHVSNFGGMVLTDAMVLDGKVQGTWTTMLSTAVIDSITAVRVRSNGYWDALQPGGTVKIYGR